MAFPIRDDTVARRTPWVTYGLILANIFVFLFLQPPQFQGGGLQGNRTDAERSAESYAYHWSVVPCEVHVGESLADGAQCDGQGADDAPRDRDKNIFLPFLTAMFLHGSVVHLAGNMLFLWVFGKSIEDRLGPLPFLALYLVTGVVASGAHVLFHLEDAVPVLGASGAIAGVLGAALILRPRIRILAVIVTAAFQVVYVPAYVLLGLFFATQFLTPDDSGVAWVAHVAGMLTGAALAIPLGLLIRDRLDGDAPEPAAATAPLTSAPGGDVRRNPG